MSMTSIRSTMDRRSSEKSETVNYLLHYQAMVRHQDSEFEATQSHMQHTVDRIKQLGRRSGSQTDTNSDMLTYLEMRRCLLRLGYTWNRCLPPRSETDSNNSSYFYDGYDDDVSLASVNSQTTLTASASGSISSSHTIPAARDIIAMDAQLIMLLTTLVEMEERHRKAIITRNSQLQQSATNHDKNNDLMSLGLYLPEFIQAYKLIIGGMQSLQTMPNPELDSPETVASKSQALNLSGFMAQTESLFQLRKRCRERTLGLLTLFGPEQNLTPFDEGEESLGGGSVTFHQSAGESPTSRNHDNTTNSSFPFPRGVGVHSLTPNRSNIKGGSNRKITPKDGLQPRLSDAEIRKLVHSKDTALAKILEEHESEINVMANSMEEMRLKEVKIQAILEKRRRSTRSAAIIGMIVMLVGGLGWEYHRTEQVKQKIALEREVGRMADAKLMERLNSEIAALQQKLSDAEATIRYEEGRYETIKVTSQKSIKELEVIEGKWLKDQGELDRCRTAQKTITDELTTIKSKNADMQEKVGWCRERLEGAERAMEGMERALKKSRENAAISVPTFAQIAKEIQVDDGRGLAIDWEKKIESTHGGTGDGKGTKIKPVQMEMKYNRAFRNAVILRQAYSAVGGVLISVFLQGLLPGFGKVISFFF